MERYAILTADPGNYHNPLSQRLDAKLIAKLYGVTLTRLAHWSNLKYNTLKKTPDSIKAQRPLQKLVNAWEILGDILGDQTMIQQWLNRPVRTIEGAAPIALLDKNDEIYAFHEFVKSFVVDTRT